jgi:hypothetical protein
MLLPEGLALWRWARTLGLTNDGGREPGEDMATTSGDGCAVLREIAEIAVSAVAVAERAEAILVALQALIPFEGGPVLLVDVATGGLMPLMSQGYDAGTRAYVSDPNNVREADVAGVSRSRGRSIRGICRPVRWIVRTGGSTWSQPVSATASAWGCSTAEVEESE